MRPLVRAWSIICLLIGAVAVQACSRAAASQSAGEGDASDFVVVADPSKPAGLTVVVSIPTPAVTTTVLAAGPLASIPFATKTKTPPPVEAPTLTPGPTSTRTPAPTATATFVPTDTPLPTYTPVAIPTMTPTQTTVAADPIMPDLPLQAQQLTLRVPILMYHYLSTPPPGADAIRRDLSTSPEQFEAQLAYLKEAGYQTINLKDLAYTLTGAAELPPRPIIITFDDGHRDQYEYAFPLLKKYGNTATFFVFTQPIDTYNIDYLTWEMIIEMHQAGMEFGSHSYRHLDLRERNVDFLVYEIVGSKEAIEARINEPVHFFAYPAGRYDPLTIQILESANFWGAVTTQWGIEQSYTNRFEMVRLRMRGNDTVQDLKNKLAAF